MRCDATPPAPTLAAALNIIVPTNAARLTQARIVVAIVEVVQIHGINARDLVLIAGVVAALALC